MGKSKKPKIVQQLLDDSALSVNSLIEEVKATKVTITWPLKNYSKIKEGADMRAHVSSPRDKWLIKLTKTNHDLRIMLTFHVSSNMKCVCFGIRNSDGEMYESFPHIPLPKSLAILIQNETILDPQNKLLNDDILILQWTYTAQPYENNIVLMHGWQSTHFDLMQNYHADSLCNDLKDLFLEARFTDFTIVFNSAFFKVHKFILCSRSTYFERVANEYPGYKCEEIWNDMNPDIMYNVLLYMYSGYLIDMDVSDMTEVFDLACFLEIKSLIKMCKVFFKTNLSIQNLTVITTVIKKYGETEIGEAIRKFLDNQPESVLQSDVWKDDVEEVRAMLKWMDRTTNNLISIKTV